MSTRPVIVLFRNDLRIADNGALAAAADSGKPVVAVYVLDEESDGMRSHGGASRWWMNQSLAALSDRLDKLDQRLVLRRGATAKVVDELIAETGADAVFWNRHYDPGGVAVGASLKQRLSERGLDVRSFDGGLLHEPSRLMTGGSGFYKVFTPFWNAMTSGPEPRDPIDAPDRLNRYRGALATERIADLFPLPSKPDWAGGLSGLWRPGETGAHERLSDFLSDGLDGYSKGRDLPGKTWTSGLSPHLAHGEITPYQIFSALRNADPDAGSEDVTKFRKEVGWREFCHHLLFHFPQLATRNFQPAFDTFKWVDDPGKLGAWQKGMTGYPIVDAGMRELWKTGTMHNRVRMVVASFLTKHLLTDWRVGEAWFWDTLVDADAASNPANWQWVAGSGADAAPYFRIFNPVLQGEKFDPEGSYVRSHVPELAALPDRYLHKPWQAPPQILATAGVELGKTYPKPIVDHKKARDRALAAYNATRNRV